MINLIIHSDGGARGNPGPAAIGVVIQSEKEIKEISRFIGNATNNQAEYQAVIEALKWIKENIKEEFQAVFNLDSELVVRQLNGEYKIKNEGLRPLYSEIRALVIDLGGNISFKHVRREENSQADKLVNEALDKHLEKS